MKFTKMNAKTHLTILLLLVLISPVYAETPLEKLYNSIKISQNPLSIISAEPLIGDHIIIVYITNDLDESFIKNKLDISMKRLQEFTGTKWLYLIKKINSNHKNWDTKGEQELFWGDVYNQVNLKQDFEQFDHYMIITSAPLKASNGYLIVKTYEQALSYSSDNRPTDPVIPAHELLHEYGMTDTYNLPNWLDYENCISNGNTNLNNKIDACGQSLTHRDDKIEYYDEFLFYMGVEGTLSVTTNADYLWRLNPTIDGYNVMKSDSSYHTLFPTQKVTPGTRTIKYDNGKIKTIYIAPFSQNTIHLDYTDKATPQPTYTAQPTAQPTATPISDYKGHIIITAKNNDGQMCLCPIYIDGVFKGNGKIEEYVPIGNYLISGMQVGEFGEPTSFNLNIPSVPYTNEAYLNYPPYKPPPSAKTPAIPTDATIGILLLSYCIIKNGGKK